MGVTDLRREKILPDCCLFPLNVLTILDYLGVHFSTENSLRIRPNNVRSRSYSECIRQRAPALQRDKFSYVLSTARLAESR